MWKGTNNDLSFRNLFAKDSDIIAKLILKYKVGGIVVSPKNLKS